MLLILNILLFLGSLLSVWGEYKLALCWIVDHYSHKDAHHAFWDEIVYIDAFVAVDELGEGNGASRIEQPTDGPHDEISPCHTSFLAMGVSENVTIIQTAVGYAACHHTQSVCQAIIESYDVG